MVKLSLTVAALAVGLGLAVGSCTLFEGDIPDKSCKATTTASGPG